MEREVHEWLVTGVFAVGAVTVVATSLIKAPYGRHLRSGWGPTVPNRVGWIAMETPSVVLFAALYMGGSSHSTRNATTLIAAALWCMHYTYRSFIYPFLIRSDPAKRMPIVVMLLGDAYNCVNSYVNARYLAEFGDYTSDAPFDRLSFWLGLLLFLVGFAVNLHSDWTLISLRKPGDVKRYRIPRGGLFEYVSCPNYLGELLEWSGWALLTLSPAGASFAFYTACNLVPRAVSNHQWYHEKFKDTYPKSRRAIIPWLF